MFKFIQNTHNYPLEVPARRAGISVLSLSLPTARERIVLTGQSLIQNFFSYFFPPPLALTFPTFHCFQTYPIPAEVLRRSAARYQPQQHRADQQKLLPFALPQTSSAATTATSNSAEGWRRWANDTLPKQGIPNPAAQTSATTAVAGSSSPEIDYEGG